ncbi:hypothetical protein [Streptomyces sp. NPDC058466]|uniref:hypothetical protein n=1 Tax=Streptomyces sp. NPDC058466 TaxID=3346512 RepID=UPI00364D3AB6
MTADEFNALYEIGIPVFAYPGARPEDIPSARRLVTRTRSEAQPVGLDREGVVWVDGHGAYIALTHVDVISEEEFKAARAEETAAAVAELGALPMPTGPTLRNASVIPLPSSWSCAYGLSDDEPFCTEDGDGHVCPTIRVHRDDAEQFAALVARAHELEGERDRLRVELDRRTEDVAFLERATLPELRREVEHHKAGKERWRDRAEKAEPERDALQGRLHQIALAKVWTNEDRKQFVFVEDIVGPLFGIEPKGAGR